MRPNWFHKITLKPLTSDYTNLVGASGVLYSNNFGNAGFSIVKNKLKTSDSLMLRATFGWHPIHKIEIKNGKLAFEWNWSFRPAPEPSDLKILLMADHLLGDETSWEKNDDRDCRADSANSKFSLYCAIYQSTKSLTSDFNHRGAALEILRKTIRETKPDKKYQHDMMDFNNQSSFSEIKALLLLSIANLNKSLSESTKK